MMQEIRIEHHQGGGDPPRIVSGPSSGEIFMTGVCFDFVAFDDPSSAIAFDCRNSIAVRFVDAKDRRIIRSIPTEVTLTLLLPETPGEDSNAVDVEPWISDDGRQCFVLRLDQSYRFWYKKEIPLFRTRPAQRYDVISIDYYS